MPTSVMALLALMVCGVLGILLITTVILERSVRVRAAKRYAAHPIKIHVPSGAGNLRHPKPR
jgi:hypothetical protein